MTLEMIVETLLAGLAGAVLAGLLIAVACGFFYGLYLVLCVVKWAEDFGKKVKP
jgi:hypothetical protein